MKSGRLPVLFVGHGSPMNAIADNTFTRTLFRLGQDLPRPESILCVSAHWMTQGTCVNTEARPRTIHDFGGFPQALFNVRYPAPGNPALAARVQKLVKSTQVRGDETWGFDHGTWSVLRHLYPQADIPVVQLSIDMSQPADYHFKIGRELAALRDEGVMIVASGDIVHNLRLISWQSDAPALGWAKDFEKWFIEKLQARDFNALQTEFLNSDEGRLSVPTPDHYIPLYYILGASAPEDVLKLEFEEIQNGSISMLTFSFGR